MTPPFAYGQKVNWIGPITRILNRTNVYTVHDCFACPSCDRWHVVIVEAKSEGGKFTCTNCLHSIGARGYYGGDAKDFVPVQHNYADIRKEIADSMGETAETPDKVLKPETVNTN